MPGDQWVIGRKKLIRLALVGDASNINVRLWVAGLLSAGADIEIVSFAEWPDAPVPVHVMKIPAGAGKLRYLLCGPQVRRAVDRIDPQIVVGYYATGYGTAARLARRHPLVQVVVGNDVLVNPPGTPTHAVARRNLAAADLVVGWSKELDVAAARFGVAESRRFVSIRGIPTERFPAPRSIPPGPPRLITTRALHPYYQTDRVVGAMAHMTQSATLTIAGEGSERSRLEEQVTRLGLEDRVAFVGAIPHEELGARLREHHVYVSAVPSDGVSGSLLEAMCSGLVPVAIDNLANREWIENGVNGLLVSAGSPIEALAAACDRACTDAALRAAALETNRGMVVGRADLRANGPVFVRRFQELREGYGARRADGSRHRLRGG